MKKPVRLSRPPARRLVARILEEPALARAVQELDPRTLGRLIDHVGLEDAGEIVALATTEQLVGVFDHDLWRSPRPGVDETFDAERFAVWLEILLEAGEKVAARKLVELPEDLITMALARRVLVVDIEALAIEMQDRGGDEDVELLEKALELALNVEIDQWRVIARRGHEEGWDALASVLLAVDVQDHDFLERLLERLAHASARDIDDGGGLYQALTDEESIAADAAADREDRQARAGFIAPSQAAAFLELARRDGAAGPERDPIARAYFREHERAPHVTEGAPRKARTAPPAAGVTPLVEILRTAGVLEPQLPRLSGRPHPNATSAMRALLADLAAHDPAAYERRAEELAFLANVLVAGFDPGERPLRPLEAAEVALAVCDLGLTELGAEAAADLLFRAGWKSLASERDFVKRFVG